MPLFFVLNKIGKAFTPASFNSFTKLATVEWAVRANDTLVCLKPNIRTDLINKTKAKKILSKLDVWDDSNEELIITPSSIENILVRLYGNHYDMDFPTYDSLGNEVKVLKKHIVKDNADGFINIHQKFYIENGKLKSYVSYVSPTKKLVTPQGIDLGTSETFNTAFNKKYNYSPSPKDKIIFLKKTQRELYVDSIKKEDKYKETFGRNMVETLWPYVLANKLKVYAVPTGKLLNAKDINSALIGNPTVEVPVYDMEGNVTSKKIEKYVLSPTIFKKVIINQTWYYNDTKNIFSNKIPEIILYAKFSGEDDLKPILKISFTK